MAGVKCALTPTESHNDVVGSRLMKRIPPSWGEGGEGEGGWEGGGGEGRLNELLAGWDN